MTRSFGGFYARKLRGPSRFNWNDDTLRIIVRGLFQFHRCGPRRVSLHAIAPHLRALIREHVKSVVCASRGNSNFAEDWFERICARWIRLPSLRAVLLKLQECDCIASLVGSTSATYESLLADGFMSHSIYTAFTGEISRLHYHHPGCQMRILPAIPRSSLPSSYYGSCFYCGSVADKIDLSSLLRCECLGDGGEEVWVCYSCVEGVPPPNDGK